MSVSPAVGEAVRRRDFITGMAGSAAAWPLAVRAQQPAMPVIGVVSLLAPSMMRQPIAAFRDGLRETGYLEGRNVAVEYRFAEGNLDRVAMIVSELARLPVVVLAGPHLVARVASQEVMTIPFIFNAAEDPVQLGVVTSLSRPGGNLTGVYHFSAGLEGKRLGLLRELIPKAAAVAVLVSANYPPVEAQLRDVQEAASRMGLQLVITRAGTESTLVAAFESIVRQHVDALLVCSSPFFFTLHQQIVLLAARHAIPAIYERRDFAEAGGLMSYGTSLTDAYRQMGVYAGRIVKGDKPADLPVVQSTKFDFVINLKTARALGLEVPPTLLARADEVIE